MSKGMSPAVIEEVTEVFQTVARQLGGDDSITKEELCKAHNGDFKVRHTAVRGCFNLL